MSSTNPVNSDLSHLDPLAAIDISTRSKPADDVPPTVSDRFQTPAGIDPATQPARSSMLLGKPVSAPAAAARAAEQASTAPRAPRMGEQQGARDMSSSRTAPTTLERALLELALIPEAGWTVAQAEAFRTSAAEGKRSPADVVELIGFLQAWRALPRTEAAAAFACELLASSHPVDVLRNSVSGVWSYSDRQARELLAPFAPGHEAALVRAALGNPKRDKHVLLVLNAADNEGGFHAYRSDLRLEALTAALSSQATPQQVLQWALDARRIGIDAEADVAVFVRLLTQP